MNTKNVLIVGGSGFVGRHLAARLSARNVSVLVPTRRRERARHLLPLPTLQVVEADLADDATLDALVAGQDAVVNLVGILHGNWGEPYGSDFANAHVALPRRLAQACGRAGVRRFLHMSALGVHEPGASAPSMYLRSKADGEAAVRESDAIDWTIFRPSVIFGPGDGLLNMFAAIQRALPVMPLARAQAKFQPVYVGDVAQAFVNAIDNPATFGRTYELAGPDVYTLADLARVAGRLCGHPRPVWHLPDFLGQIQAALLELMPGEKLMSRDNFESLASDNLATGPIAPELGIVPARLEAIAPRYISAVAPFATERARAHR